MTYSEQDTIIVHRLPLLLCSLVPMTNEPANSMENSPVFFLEANIYSASQEIPLHLWILKIHYRVLKSLLLGPVHGKINSVHIFPASH